MAPTDGALHARLLWGLVGASFLGFAAGDLAGALALSLLLVGILGPSLWGARAQLGVRTLSLARAAREGLVGRGVVGRVIGVARALLGAALVLIAWDALPPLLLFALALLLGGRGMQRQGSARAGLLGAALLLASCSILLANGLGLFTPICAVGLWLLSPALSSLSPLAERVLSLPALEGLAQRLAGAGVS